MLTPDCMKLNEFEKLSGFEKVEALNVYGVFLSERRIGADRVYLYVINYFYIELFHELSDIHNRGVSVYSVFDDVKYLDAYLEKVDITPLMNA
jgi:hypothetical protein